MWTEGFCTFLLAVTWKALRLGSRAFRVGYAVQRLQHVQSAADPRSTTRQAPWAKPLPFPLGQPPVLRYCTCPSWSGYVESGLLGQVLCLAFPFSCCYGVREYTCGELPYDFDFQVPCWVERWVWYIEAWEKEDQTACVLLLHFWKRGNWCKYMFRKVCKEKHIKVWSLDGEIHVWFSLFFALLYMLIFIFLALNLYLLYNKKKQNYFHFGKNLSIIFKPGLHFWFDLPLILLDRGERDSLSCIYPYLLHVSIACLDTSFTFFSFSFCFHPNAWNDWLDPVVWPRMTGFKDQAIWDPLLVASTILSQSIS